MYSSKNSIKSSYTLINTTLFFLTGCLASTIVAGDLLNLSTYTLYVELNLGYLVDLQRNRVLVYY